ncbi:hypothetical protein [Perlabentimonas gracilis]|uniref:hypothetical protein n=1 Tax=Perlabentimonas gracilis TaxID=2715279 RepID=UPI0014089BB4|nr:hypothetical protein [Perlabentimonas gracilis]NHB69783.1 hypothetical protein [Perlabentimonas gracilis]
MKTAKNILTLLLSAYLLLAMGGFSVFHHLCNCSSEARSNTSILVEQSCCSSDAVNSTSCHSESNTCGEGGCEDCSCETEVEVLAITESLIVENIRLTSPSIFLINIFDTVQDVDNSEIDSKPLTSFKDLSPPRPGKSIVISNQCLKIPIRA